MSAQPKPRISTRFIYPPAPAKGLDAWCAWLRQEAIARLDFAAGSAQYHGLCGLRKAELHVCGKETEQPGGASEAGAG